MTQPSMHTSPYDYIQHKNTVYARNRYTRNDESLEKSPYVSPVWYDWARLRASTDAPWPKTLAIWGACEIFADEDQLLVDKMVQEGGLELEKDVIGMGWPDMIHDFTLLPIREAKKGLRYIADFILDRPLRGPDTAAL